MENKTKALGGISIIGIIIFSIIAMQRNNHADEWRNEQIKRDYESQQTIKRIREQAESMRPVLEPYKDLKDSSDCYLNPVKINKSFKINVNINYPCRWQKMDLVKNNSDLVAQYANIITDTTMVAMSVSIKDYNITFNEDNIGKLRNEDFAKTNASGSGQEFLSFKKIVVDGIKGDETLSMLMNDAGANYFRTNYFYYKTFILTVKYLATAPTKYTANKLLRQYEKLFDQIRDRTDFVN